MVLYHFSVAFFCSRVLLLWCSAFLPGICHPYSALATAYTITRTLRDRGRSAISGLHTQVFMEQQLGKEIARARRQNTALSLATIHLDEFTEMTKRHGLSATAAALKELARRMKKACRGSDFAARLAEDDFLLVLPECNLGEVKSVLNRIGVLEVSCAGRRVNIAYTTGFVDYQPGDLPGYLLKRAAH